MIAAIEILSDPVKRRAFDSVDPTFDNTVPSKAEGKEKFFDVFAPVFERNARSVKPKKKKKNHPNVTEYRCVVYRNPFEICDTFLVCVIDRWSTKKHVAAFGSMDSSFEEVDNFYSFW